MLRVCHNVVHNDFSINDLEKAVIKIYSQNGQLVKAMNVNYLNGMIRLELSNLSKGMYILEISVEHKKTESINVIKR